MLDLNDPNARLIGNLVEDKKRYGTVHFAKCVFGFPIVSCLKICNTGCKFLSPERRHNRNAFFFVFSDVAEGTSRKPKFRLKGGSQ